MCTAFLSHKNKVNASKRLCPVGYLFANKQDTPFRPTTKATATKNVAFDIVSLRGRGFRVASCASASDAFGMTVYGPIIRQYVASSGIYVSASNYSMSFGTDDSSRRLRSARSSGNGLAVSDQLFPALSRTRAVARCRTK